MSLNSIYFLPFMLFVVIGLTLLQFAGKFGLKKYSSVQKIFLLLCSYIFIGLSNYHYCIIMILTSVFVYFMGILLSNKKNRLLLVIGISILVVELAYFKYTNFFLSTLNACFGNDFVLLNIILPLGISFYIFTAIGYLVDVYKDKYSPEKNFIHLALLISMFTKVISGPIVRGNQFLPQLRDYKGVSVNGLLYGTQIFFFGLFKKIVLADRLNLFVNDVFTSPSAFNTFSVVLAVISYSLQIYFDFSGYSDMAIGTSKIIGIEIEPNFNLPYISKNSSEFWGRWHISLSSWLKDYIYIPLGGSKKGKLKTYINLLITMIISGLWHGAGLTFIIWGFLHGIYSCVCKLFTAKSLKGSPNKHSIIKDAVCVLVNFIVITLLWVFFRAGNLKNAMNILLYCFTSNTGINQPYFWSVFALLLLLLATAVAFIVSKKAQQNKINAFYPCLDLSKIRNQIMFFTFVGITIIIGYFGNTAFIYDSF